MRSPGRILTSLRQREKLLRAFSILLGTEQKANQSPKSAETEHLFPQKELKNIVMSLEYMVCQEWLCPLSNFLLLLHILGRCCQIAEALLKLLLKGPQSNARNCA